MKKILFYVLLIASNFGLGWFIGQRQTNFSSKTSFNVDELKTINEMREKCKTADKKNVNYFKKYGTHESGKDLLHDEEFTDVGEWEQACNDTFELLRDQFRNEK